MKLTNLLLRYEQFMNSDKGDKVGIVSTVGLITLVTVNGLVALYQQLNESNSTNILTLLCLGIFLLFNVLGNMFRAVSVDTTINSIDLPTVLLPEWRYCSFCEQNAPPRCKYELLYQQYRIKILWILELTSLKRSKVFSNIVNHLY